MKTKKITINAPGLAAGFLDMMPDNYRGALAFGMLPAPMMQRLEDGLKDKAAVIFSGPEDIFRPDEVEALKAGGLFETMLNLSAHERDKWVKETMHILTLAIYEEARKRGILRV